MQSYKVHVIWKKRTQIMFWSELMVYWLVPKILIWQKDIQGIFCTNSLIDQSNDHQGTISLKE
jgi:hypothetical protein